MGKVKTFFWICVVAIACGACDRKKTEKTGAETDTLVIPVTVADTLVEEETLDTLSFSSVREKYFSGEDGIFEEFVYEFFSDTLMQKHRIRFPLSYVGKGEERQLGEQDWASSTLFALPDIYHTLFEHDVEMDVERDTSMQKVNLECVDVKGGLVRIFFFEKQEGHWLLLRVREQDFSSYKHREFFTFYHRFATDSLFQSHHVNDPMTFVTVDPEDDFNILEANIDMEQWFAFRPILPEHLLVHVDYGVKPSRRPQRKILTCKSLGGNFNTTSYFRRIGGEWMLTRFEDMSN